VIPLDRVRRQGLSGDGHRGRSREPREACVMWRVLGTKGCGSTIVEAALALAGVPYEREEAEYDQPAGRQRLLEVNPLAQVPTVILPDGSVMTESAALVLYLDELVPTAKLLPPPGDPQRHHALRWLVFLVAALYPTFTYGDDPAKWVGDAADRLREATHEHRKKLWRQLESVARSPWFLGDQFSILDVYVSVMTRWRPRREWFAQECPRLSAIATSLDPDPRLAPVWAANF
jgi:GST-like protein